MAPKKKSKGSNSKKTESKTKTETNTDNEPQTECVKKVDTGICGCKAPGPKYVLRPVLGFKDHCLSKLRNPAYSFRRRQTNNPPCNSPGPKYLLNEWKCFDGFTFGYAQPGTVACLSPGPKYDIRKCPSGPFFTLKSRTNKRGGCGGPIGYPLKSTLNGPAFSLAAKGTFTACTGTPGPQNPWDPNVVKPRGPIYSLYAKQTGGIACNSPGPKYLPKIIKPTPIYSFGTKHSPCAPPYILPCDEQCY